MILSRNCNTFCHLICRFVVPIKHQWVATIRGHHTEEEGCQSTVKCRDTLWTSMLCQADCGPYVCYYATSTPGGEALLRYVSVRRVYSATFVCSWQCHEQFVYTDHGVSRRLCMRVKTFYFPAVAQCHSQSCPSASFWRKKKKTRLLNIF